MVARSGSVPWGNAIAHSGIYYGIMQISSLISQSMVGLVVGRSYKISWKQMNRPGSLLYYSDLHVKVDLIAVHAQSQVTDEQWTSQSALFTATKVSQTLTFYTTGICGGDCTVFLDTIIVESTIITDGGFESYDDQVSANTGYGSNKFLGPGTLI
jgi:hypothetical protein